jgi:hypothetical protein
MRTDQLIKTHSGASLLDKKRMRHWRATHNPTTVGHKPRHITLKVGRELTSGIWHPESGIRNPVSDFR